MNNIYTIGFTKKEAKVFFELIKNNKIDLVIDVRLNNVSQLAGFSKYPDIKFFFKEICQCEYISDKLFSPKESTLKSYKNNSITWDEYVIQFNQTMIQRRIDEYIINYYSNYVYNKNICFLCSEHTPDNCHRRLISEKFVKIFPNTKVIHI